MPDPIIDDKALDGNWYDSMAGEDAGKVEILSKFETADAFYDSHQGMANANWRAPFVPEGDDGKAMERFESPEAYGKAFKEAQATISAGFKPGVLPDGATDDDIKAFREANDIPADVEGYYENMPDGLILGDDDKPIADVFMNALHGANAPPAIGHALISAYNDFAEKEQDAQADMDIEQSKEATDELRGTWKGDYRQNINAVETFLEREFGKEVKDQMLNGRFGDGRAFMNDPKILEVLARVERTLNPLVPLHHTGDGDPVESMNDEITKIEKYMRTNRTDYYKDDKMQGRLRDLYEMRTKNQAA